MLTTMRLIFIVFKSDDTVAVGSDLYELDTEAEATVQASETSKPVATSSNAKESPPAPTAPSAESSKALAASSKQPEQHRVPSIQFLGKVGWSRKLAGVSKLPELPPVPTNFGRPAFTEEEMDALISGGANLVPSVKQYSNGAVFGQ